MKVTVCIGSSCHLKGSKTVVDGLQKLIDENGLAEKVELCGSFCLGECKTGVSVLVDDTYFSVSPETYVNFFETEIKAKI